MRIFREKSCKIAAASRLRPRTPVGLRRLGAPPPDPTSYIVNSSRCICPQSTDSFGINDKTLFSCIIEGVHPYFRRRKNYTVFRMPQITEIVTIGFNFLSCPSHSFCAGAAPGSNLKFDF